jgi:hypothetical protein
MCQTSVVRTTLYNRHATTKGSINVPRHACNKATLEFAPSLSCCTTCTDCTVQPSLLANNFSKSSLRNFLGNVPNLSWEKFPACCPHSPSQSSLRNLSIFLSCPLPCLWPVQFHIVRPPTTVNNSTTFHTEYSWEMCPSSLGKCT